MKYLLTFFVLLSLNSAGWAQSQCELMFQEKLWGQKFYHAYKPSKEPITVGIEVEALVPTKIGLSGIVKILESEIQKTYGEVFVDHRPDSLIEYRVSYYKSGTQYTYQVHRGWHGTNKKFIDAEISSPIVRDKNDLDFFLNTLNILKRKVKLKAQPSQAGVHVHFGFSKTSEAELGFLITLFSVLEKQILQTFSTTNSRQNRYTNTSSESLLYYLQNTPVNQLRLNSMYSVVSEKKKNYALNILSLQKYETVEMRLFNSSVNASHVLQMVNFTVGFMNAVRSKDPRLTQFLMSNKNSHQLDLQELAKALDLPILSQSEKRALRAIKFQSIKSELGERFSREN
ncbi:MAG: amidoligase family protein [Bdellovibrionales bacterium]|nr:amidoligase family protein [Bdellovibrionales bacterium]